MVTVSAARTVPASRTVSPLPVDHVFGVAPRPDASTSAHLEFTTVSLQAKVVAAALRNTVRPVLALWARTPDLPWPTRLVDHAGRFLPPVPGTECVRIDLTHCRAEWIRPAHRARRRADADRVVLYLHGGAFILCGLNTHRRMTSRIAEAVGGDVLSVGYRMMPDHSVDDAIADGVDGYRYLLDMGYAPEQIVIGGDSAGGFLALAVAIAVRAADLPAPGGLFAISPLTDFDPTAKLAHRNADRCALIPGAGLTALTRLTEKVDARCHVTEARVSPVDADLTGMPPTLIQVGSDELIYPDAELMAQRLWDAGAECELQVWKNQVHVFHAMDFIPESQRAIDEIAEFVDAVITSGAPAVG